MSNPFYDALKALKPSNVEKRAGQAVSAIAKGEKTVVNRARSSFAETGSVLRHPRRAAEKNIDAVRAQFQLLDRKFFGGKGLRDNISKIKQGTKKPQ